MYCPSCGGPGTLQFDVFGDGFVVCDAYSPCGRTLEACTLPDTRELEMLLVELDHEATHFVRKESGLVEKLANLAKAEARLKQRLVALADRRGDLDDELEQCRGDLEHARARIRDTEARLNAGIQVEPDVVRPPRPLVTA